MEVISNRRYGERRKSDVPHASDRRRGSDRRRSMKFWEDLSVYPMIVAQKFVESYEELQQKVAVAAGESQELRADNKRICDELANLQAQARADAALQADIAAILTQFEQVLGAVGESLHRFGRRAHRPEKEPRLRSA